MTKARAWILAVVLILAWTAIPDGPAAATLPDTRMPASPEDAVLDVTEEEGYRIIKVK